MSDSYNYGNNITEKVGEFFGADRKDSLPMYKDKPYSYPGRRKKLPWYRQKGTIAGVLTSLAVVSWWFGILSPLSYFTGDSEQKPVKEKSRSSWFGGKVSDAEWERRAQRVKDVFRESFDGYEKYAWGMCRVWLPKGRPRSTILTLCRVR